MDKLNGIKRTVCEIWTRAMGYCRPVSNFNAGKKSEFKERKYFTEAKAMKKIDNK
jgi:anaerobic ribonucleoside-triphosphate reductase